MANYTGKNGKLYKKKLLPRILSLYSKVIIINTLALSKTSYLSNVFLIHAKTTSEIHKKLFKYLWNNSQSEPIARKTIFLKKARRLKPD